MKLSKKHPTAITIVLGLVIGASLYGILTLNRAINTYSGIVTPIFEHSVSADTILIDFKTQVQEWKNVLLRGSDPAMRDKYWSAFLATEEVIRQANRRLVNELPPGDARSLVREFEVAHEAMGIGYRQGYEQYKAANYQHRAGDAAVKGMDREPAELLSKASEMLRLEATLSSTTAARNAGSATTISLSLILLSGVSSLVFAFRFSHSITRPILKAVDVAHRIAAGDLSQKIDVRGNDETADLLRALRDMQTRLASVVRTVRDNADSVARSTGEIVHSNQLNASQSEEQSRALTETSGSINELESVTRENTGRIGEANQLATGAAGSASHGGEAVNDVVNTMHGIHDSASRIVDITSVIDDIAFQTNILALNAAVEAARAGEEGRGFAVVASEVRVLAQRSADAAREIKTLISESVKHVANGTEVVNETGRIMNDLVSTIGNVTEIMSQVTDASQHQDQSVMRASQSIKAIEQTLHENSARVDRSNGAASNLNRQALDLVNSVSVFRLPEADGVEVHHSSITTMSRLAADQHLDEEASRDEDTPHHRDAA